MSDSDYDSDSPVAQEEEILRASFRQEELAVTKTGATTMFRLNLTPSVGGATAAKGFVRLALDLTLENLTYPDTPPQIAFSRVVGLSEAQLRALKALLEAECADLEGDYTSAHPSPPLPPTSFQTTTRHHDARSAWMRLKLEYAHTS